jgi:predicted dehydrogenase
MVTIGQIGLGYWGPNLLRNLDALPGATVKWVCDLDAAALSRVKERYPYLRTTRQAGDLWRDPEVEAVVLTSPAVTHAELVRAALEAGKHVFVEKPLALDVSAGEQLVELAEARDRRLMVGHLLLYHPAVRRLKALLDGGDLGDVYYIYSERRNLGKVRQDENAMWSLAPHDVSVILYLLGQKPELISAHGQAWLQPGIEDTVFLTLRFADGTLAHTHVSWLDPHKVRRFTIVGSRQMVVFDDVQSTEKLRIFDKGVDRVPEYNSYGEALTLRYGTIVTPHIEMREPLRLECEHFVRCVAEGTRPLSDGRSGLEVLRVLAAAQRSLANQGRLEKV